MAWLLTETPPDRETRQQQQLQLMSTGWPSMPQSHVVLQGTQSSASECTVGSPGGGPPETWDLQQIKVWLHSYNYTLKHYAF